MRLHGGFDTVRELVSILTRGLAFLFPLLVAILLSLPFSFAFPFAFAFAFPFPFAFPLPFAFPAVLVMIRLLAVD